MTKIKTFTCSCCGREKPISQLKIDENGNYICDTCAQYEYRICRECGVYFNDDRNSDKCSKHRINISPYEKVINVYSFKPEPMFVNKVDKDNRKNLNQRYYGLEMEYSNVSPSVAHNLFKDLYKEKKLYNKSDSSLYNGVEIVTSPCDLYSIKELIKDMGKGLEFISSIPNTSKNAGIHIHINRKSIDPIDVYKLSKLLNLSCNNKEMKIISYLSGRMSRTNSTPDMHYCKVGGATSLKAVKTGGNRYIALNLQNTNTIEFRIFKSTPEVNMILSYIDMVNSMIEFVHNTPINKTNITNYILYLKTKSNNKILLNKINKFEKYYGELEPYNEVYKLDINILKGISVFDYDELIPILETRRTVGEINKAVLSYKENKNSIRPNSFNEYKENVLTKILKETYKKVMINKIKKEYKEIKELCA